jgi:hypothetical protein
MLVRMTTEAALEYAALPEREQDALESGFAKLAALGEAVPFPHASAVRSVRGLRELRPRAGRCRWRAFFRRVADVIVVAAIGPEAEVDPRGFQRAVHAAALRLAREEMSSDA